jgi:DNA-directed RNA polymerase specialized sigma24 family protein
MPYTNWTDENIIASLRSGGAKRGQVWEYMFKNWRGRYLQKIHKLGGNDDEADEALAWMCISWERTVTKPDFQLHSASLAWYFDRSLINAWKKLRIQKGLSPVSLEEDNGVLSKLADDVVFIDTEIQDILDEVLEKAIGPECRTILVLFASGYSMAEIGQKTGRTADSAKNQKCRCQLSLKKYFEENPDQKNGLKKVIYG